MEHKPLTTIAEVEELAAKHGILLDADDYTAARNIGQARQTQLMEQVEAAPQNETWAARFNRVLPAFLRALISIGDVSIIILQTILVGPGALIILIMLLIVEQQRVAHGVSLFEVGSVLAGFGAIVFVVLNLILELLISYREYRAGWVEPPKNEFSLRLFRQRMAYMLGNAQAWTPRPKSPAMRERTYLRLLTFTILALALGGSMRNVIEKAQGNWYQAIQNVATQSTLLEFTTWIGGLLFAASAVLGAQVLTAYAAKKSIEIAEIINSTQEDKPRLIMEAANMSAAAALLARLNEKKQVRKQMAAVSAAVFLPTVSGVLKTEQTPETDPTPKLSPTVQKAVSWFENDPERLLLSVRVAAAESNLDPNAIHKAKKHLKDRA